MLKCHSWMICITMATSALLADEGPTEDTVSLSSETVVIETATPAVTEQVVVAAKPVVVAPVVEESFAHFTGRIKKNKSRLRVSADLESSIAKELGKNDMLIVIGQKGDFYAVEPPTGTKAYIFRSFVLDGIVEGNRVNVRLGPSTDAPVIGHMNSGDQIKGSISSLNNKWYEITPPGGARFYVAKELVEYAGGAELKAQHDRRKISAEQLFDASILLTQSEMQKPFAEIDMTRVKNNFETIISDYAEFTDVCEKAKEKLAAIQEEYLSMRIAFLEEKAGLKESVKGSHGKLTPVVMQPTDRMKLWTPVEESLYLTWASRNDDRSIEEFYEDQKQNSVAITGIVEAYTNPVKRKPGDFILRDKDLPVAYLYSTQIDLSGYVGKKVTVVAAPRSNNNFAFPAYYVLEVE